MVATTLPSTASPEQRTEHPHITRIDGIAQLSGTRIPVRLIAQMYRAGDSVDDILRGYSHLKAAAVHDAISYYLDHQVEIDQEIAAHRVEYLLTQTGAQLNERGFINFPSTQADG
jgi:uncharacterized protein (DUF433 family)